MPLRTIAMWFHCAAGTVSPVDAPLTAQPDADAFEIKYSKLLPSSTAAAPPIDEELGRCAHSVLYPPVAAVI